MSSFTKLAFSTYGASVNPGHFRKGDEKPTRLDHHRLFNRGKVFSVKTKEKNEVPFRLGLSLSAAPWVHPRLQAGQDVTAQIDIASYMALRGSIVFFLPTYYLQSRSRTIGSWPRNWLVACGSSACPAPSADLGEILFIGKYQSQE